MFNLVVLSGRLTATPELKTTPNGVSVCSFAIANETGYGENKKTSFINVVAWRKTAKSFNLSCTVRNWSGAPVLSAAFLDSRNCTLFATTSNRVRLFPFWS